MKTLFVIELKRMLKSKTTMLVVLIGLILPLLFSVYVFRGEIYEQLLPSGEVVTLNGFDAVRERKTVEQPIQGKLTEEKVKEAVESLQSVYSKYASYDRIPQEVYLKYIAPYDNLQFILIMAIPDYDNSKTTTPWSIDEKIINSFNENYFTNIRASAEKTYQDNLAVKQEVLRKIDQVENDGLYYFTNHAWGSLLELYPFFLLFLSVLVSVLFASSFSRDYQNGMGEVFASTLHGKRNLAIAKSMVCMTITILYYLVSNGIFFLINLSLYGSTGLQSSLQLEFPYLFAPGTFGDAFFSMIILGFCMALAQSCLTLLFSSLSREILPSTVLSLLFAIFPFIFSLMIDRDNKLSLLTNILPSSGAQGYFELFSDRYLKLGNNLFWYPDLMWISAILYILILPVITTWIYKKHQYR